jgi:hypothetical protein
MLRVHVDEAASAELTAGHGRKASRMPIGSGQRTIVAVNHGQATSFSLTFAGVPASCAVGLRAAVSTPP